MTLSYRRGKVNGGTSVGADVEALLGRGSGWRWCGGWVASVVVRRLGSRRWCGGAWVAVGGGAGGCVAVGWRGVADGTLP